MKRIFLIMTVLALVVALTACGSSAPAQTAPSPVASPVATPETTLSTEPASPAPATPTPAPTKSASLPDATLQADTSAPAAENEDFTTAKSFVDKPLSELVSVLGEPLSSSYVTSCLGPGQDGELRYDGFTVYTYNNGQTETILDVIAD